MLNEEVAAVQNDIKERRKPSRVYLLVAARLYPSLNARHANLPEMQRKRPGPAAGCTKLQKENAR